MNDERFLRDWLRDTTDSTTDPNAAADKVVAQIPDTPQRHRWLPWPPARRPKLNEPNGRTRLMLSPVTAITIGALALTASGAFYLAQSPSDGAGPVPAAEAGPGTPPQLFSGSLAMATDCNTPMQRPEIEVGPNARKERGQVFYCFVWETTDPRLNGRSTVVWNNDIVYASGDTPQGMIGSGRELITTPDGTWEGTLTKLMFGDEIELESGWYVGGGGHDGLVAHVTLQDGGDSLWGYVSDEPPPVPDEVPTQE